MAMTKAEIVERIYEKVEKDGFSKKDAAEVVESIFEIIKRHLERGEKVKISGFGNFVVHTKRPRKGRNPQTGEEIVINPTGLLDLKCPVAFKFDKSALPIETGWADYFEAVTSKKPGNSGD